MNKQNSKHIKTIQKKNKQYDDGGNLLNTSLASVGAALGTTLGSIGNKNNRTSVIGDALGYLAAPIGTMAGSLITNNTTTDDPIKKTNNTSILQPYEPPIYKPNMPQLKYTSPKFAVGGALVAGAISTGIGALGSGINSLLGKNKQGIAQEDQQAKLSQIQAANLGNVQSMDDLLNSYITPVTANPGNFGKWSSGYGRHKYGIDQTNLLAQESISHNANRLATQNELSLKQNYASFGGNLNTAGADFTTGMKHINTGDTHENNPYEGVPMGVDPQGTPNLVEEGETIYNDYVFSDRLKVPKQKIKKGQTKFTQEEKVLHKYEGKTYADAAKKAEKDSGVDERPNDNIAKRGFETILEILAQSQEQQRAEEDKEKMQQQLEALQEYLNSLPPEEREQIIQQIQQQLTGQEVPQQEIPQQVQQQGIPQDQQQMMQQQQQLSPEEIAMMQQQQSQQQEMSPEQQAMLQQQMQQQPPMEEQPMQEPQQQVQAQAYGGKLYEEGGQLSPEQMAMLQQQQGTPQQEVTPPTEPQSPQDLPPEYQGQEVPQGVEEVPQEGQQQSTQEVPQETPQEQIDQSPAEMIDTNVNPEDMSTTELNKKIDEIIRYAKDTQDKQLAREARKIKKKGTRTEKEEFVQETLEEIKEEQDQIRQDKAVKEENIKQQQAQQQQLAEEQAAQMQQQQQMPQEEQVPQEAMQQEGVPQEAVKADAGQALDAQEVPQEMQETPMMANGGQLYAQGGAIDMGAVLAAIFEKNKNNPAMMSKFRRLQNCTDPQLQNDIAREIIELDRNSSYSCGGKLYADGGDISSQVAQYKNLYSQIAEKDPNITQLFNQMLSSITPDVATQIQKQYGLSSEDYAIFATVNQYMQQYQNNQAANGGKLQDDIPEKIKNYIKESWTTLDNYPELRQTLIDLFEKYAQDETANTSNISSDNQVNTEDIQENVQQPKEEDSKAENNILQNISPAIKVAIEKDTEITEKQKKIDEKIEELVDGLLKSSGIKSKKLSPELQAYRDNIKTQLKDKLPEILQNGKDISDVSINDIKDLNLLGTEGLNKTEARKTVLNNANIYSQQQLLITNKFGPGNLTNNKLSWDSSYNSPWSINEKTPYELLQDPNQIYMDFNNGVYRGINKDYQPSTPFDLQTHGTRYTGDYKDASSQGFYRRNEKGDISNNYFYTNNGNDIDKADKALTEYYVNSLFKYIANTRSKKRVQTDNSGKYFVPKGKNNKKENRVYFQVKDPDTKQYWADGQWAKMYLTGAELRDWVQKLENSNEPADKALAQSIKASWGDENTNWDPKTARWHLRQEKNKDNKEYGDYSDTNTEGYLKESNNFLRSIDWRTNKPRSETKRTSDAVLGNDHPASIKALLNNEVNTYWVQDGTNKDGTPNYKRVILGSDALSNINKYSPTDLGSIADNGYTIHRYLLNNDANRYAIKVGDKVYTIDKSKLDDPSSLGLKVSTQTPYQDVKTPGLNGKTTWLEFDKDSKTDSTSPLFPFPSKVPLLAGIGLQAGTTLFNALKPIDYSNADALANLAATTGRTASTISPVKIGDYLTYRPVDRNFIANQTLAQANNINRTLAGLSGGNRGTAAANILGNDYNTLVALGTDYMNAYEKNREQEQKVAQFNRETNKLNADWQMAADRANQDAYNKRLDLQANFNKDAINMRNTLETNKGNAISAGLTGLANLVYNLYQDDYNKKLQKYSIDMGNYGPSTRYEYPKTSGAKGGKLRTRRKRTFNI